MLEISCTPTLEVEEHERELEPETWRVVYCGKYLSVAMLCMLRQVGSFYEFFNKNAIFGVVEPDSPLWLPILGLFAVTGLPTSGLALHILNHDTSTHTLVNKTRLFSKTCHLLYQSIIPII